MNKAIKNTFEDPALDYKGEFTKAYMYSLHSYSTMMVPQVEALQGKQRATQIECAFLEILINQKRERNRDY